MCRKGADGMGPNQHDTYNFDLLHTESAYSTGASNIISFSKAKKWLSQFLELYKSSVNLNIRAVAYMMDTNSWGNYYAGVDAEYAMGGPTIEMFCESYKDTHPTKYLECGNLNLYGYQVRWNGGSWEYDGRGLMQDEFNSIYIKSDISKARNMWTASPCASGYSSVVYSLYIDLLFSITSTAAS